MRIVSLKAENFKRLQAVEVRPDPKGGLVRITGKNDQGKSSLLDAIAAALGGADAVPLKPIRNGEQRGEIVLELDGLIVRRSFTEKGTQLTVKNAEGASYPSPQAMLDKLVGKLTFDPLAFMRMDPRKQSETLRQLLGLDFNEIDAERKAVFEERTDVGRGLKEIEAQIKAITVPDDAPDEEVDAAKLMQEIEEANEQNRRNEAERTALNGLRQNLELANWDVDTLRQKLAEAEAMAAQLDAKERAQAEVVEALEDIDTASLREQISNVREVNEAARAKAQKKALEQRGQRGSEKWKALTKTIKELDERKAKQIAEAKMPVEGLSLNEDGVVLYRDIPLSQASSSGQLHVSVAMAMAMNPKLRVIRISDGSLLDSESLKVIEAMARDGDYQIWIEMVDESGEMGVVIEDGLIRGASKAEAKPEAEPAISRPESNSQGESQQLF